MQGDLAQIIADIPWDFDPRDKGSIARNWSKLNRLRKSALATPLRAGIEFSVNLECPIIERERPILSLARTKEPCRLVLRTPLQTGVDRWSQVWIVSVHSSSLEPTSFPSEAAELAVVKIIQPSMLKIVHPDFPGDVYEYTPPRHVATREHLVYLRLEKAQGSAVPYYYGMTQATMPNGESAWMHVIEYIPGKSSDQVKSGLKPKHGRGLNPYLKELYISTLKSLREIHDQRVLHKDLDQPKNIILYESPDSRPRVVIIDFTTSNAVDEMTNFMRKRDIEKALMTLCYCCKRHKRYLDNLELPDGLMYTSTDKA